MTESRSLEGSRVGQEEEITKEHKGTFRMMDMFTVLSVVMVSHVETCQMHTLNMCDVLYANYTSIKTEIKIVVLIKKNPCYYLSNSFSLLECKLHESNNHEYFTHQHLADDECLFDEHFSPAPSIQFGKE